MKFSIRDLMFVTVIVALAVGWWLDRSQVAKRAGEAEKENVTLRELVRLYVPDAGMP